MKRRNNPIWPAVEKISGALIGVDLIALIQLIGLQDLTVLLRIAAVFFATSLPVLAFVVVSRLLKLPAAGAVGLELFGFGAMSAVIGTALMTFHLSLITGVVFCILLVPGLIVVFVSRWPDDV